MGLILGFCAFDYNIKKVQEALIEEKRKKDENVFQFTFPVDTNSVTEYPGGAKMDKQIRILVVDDEPRICHLIEDVLVKEGYTVDISFSGTDALQMIKIYDYHLLITDLDMPGIDGLELIQKIKKQNSEIRVIMITGNTKVDLVTLSLRYGINDYINKPFNITKLREAVKQTLCSHKIVLRNL